MDIDPSAYIGSKDDEGVCRLFLSTTVEEFGVFGDFIEYKSDIIVT